MKTYTAANGMEYTDEMIDRWCEAYERGEFPDGEHTVGTVGAGRPPLSGDKTVTLTVKLPASMKVAAQRKAKQEGISTAAYVRNLVADDLLAV